MEFNKQHGCDAFGKCSISLKDMNNEGDLYSQRIYDDQNVHARCYDKHPVNIVEAFGFGFSFKKLLKWIIIVLILLVLIGYFVDNKKMALPGIGNSNVISIPIETPSTLMA